MTPPLFVDHSCRIGATGPVREVGLALAFDPTTLEVRRDDLEAFDIAEAVLGKDFYGPIVRTLVHYGGYVRAMPGCASTSSPTAWAA
jgi:hypothetical protein